MARSAASQPAAMVRCSRRRLQPKLNAQRQKSALRMPASGATDPRQSEMSLSVQSPEKQVRINTSMQLAKIRTAFQRLHTLNIDQDPTAQPVRQRPRLKILDMPSSLHRSLNGRFTKLRVTP